MPNDLQTETVTNFSELLAAIEAFQEGTEASWYRGCKSSRHQLVPTLFRHEKKKAIEDLLELERSITTRFVQRSIPYVARALDDEWDKMFFMQHYGVPTRLLDWTENPLVAAFFAVEDAARTRKGKAAVWMCDPITWNRSALSHISFSGGILDQSSPALNNHKPGTDVGGMPSHPVMIFGSYNSARIVAQRGVFCLFGKEVTPLEETYKKDAYSPECLKKIEIPENSVRSVRNSLYRKGITESVVFPEIDGLAKEIRREYEY